MDRLTTEQLLYRDVQSRYRNMYIPSDFSKLVARWVTVRAISRTSLNRAFFLDARLLSPLKGCSLT